MDNFSPLNGSARAYNKELLFLVENLSPEKS
jgi:hypothetical protein